MGKKKKSVAGMIKALMQVNPKLTIDEAASIVVEARDDIIKIEIIPISDDRYRVRTTRSA